MKPYDLNEWDEFRPLIQKIRDEYGLLKRTENYSKKNLILFRGQGQADWSLETTLERFSEKEFSVNSYLLHVSYCVKELESLTGKNWNIPDWRDIEKEINDNHDLYRPYLPYYDFLIYLRHHSFPSPLLDWTTSPYIAAYFAFCDKKECERVVVFCYIGSRLGGRSISRTKPQIREHGPYVKTHNRHFAQKAWYTTATKYDFQNKIHNFCNHFDVFKEEDENQDILIKITIPSSERMKALEELSDYNINHYTLFQTEEALVKTMAIKEFEMKID